GLVATPGLDGGQRRTRLLPGELALAAFAVGQANDLDAKTPLGVQRDRAAGAPDEIPGMGRYDKSGLHGMQTPLLAGISETGSSVMSRQSCRESFGVLAIELEQPGRIGHQ